MISNTAYNDDLWWKKKTVSEKSPAQDTVETKKGKKKVKEIAPAEISRGKNKKSALNLDN